jgi:predicted nucleic acid-binding protein
MSGDFVDSNILVYLFDDADPAKKATATRLIDAAVDNESATISFQVVQEVLNTVTRKLAVPLRPERAQFMLDEVLSPIWRVWPTPDLYHQAIRIHGRYQYGFYDALIIAAALEAGCDRLLTEDLQHGQVIEGVRIENPFVASSP